MVDKLTIDEDPKVLRSKVKQVIVEMTGSGNPECKGSAKNNEDNLFIETEGSLLQYKAFRLAALEVMPALQKLNTFYLNATGFLSYYEANMLTETLLRLKEMGIPVGLVTVQSGSVLLPFWIVFVTGRTQVTND